MLADFIGEGYFFSHLRRMRSLYGQRQAVFVDAINRYISLRQPLIAPPGGMQVALPLPPHCPDKAAVERLLAAGINARPLSLYGLPGAAGVNGLHLGFAAVPETRIDATTRRLQQILGL